MRLMLLGAPGSGKRTLIKRIAAARRIPVIATADLPADTGPPEQALRRRLSTEDPGTGFVLDVIPDTPEQAAGLDRLLSDLGLPLDLVLQIDMDRAALLQRLSNRLSCRDCGATCNLFANPPQVEGVCDHCGGPLRRDPVASGQALQQQLQRYADRIQHLLDYYQEEGRLRRIRGEAEPDDLYAAARRIMEVSEQRDGEADDWLPPPNLAPSTSSPAGSDDDTLAADSENGAAATTEGPPETGAKSGSWKRAAENRGRIKRRSLAPPGGHGGKGKPRR